MKGTQLSSASKQTQPNSDTAVAERYSAAAEQREEALCCPVSYRPELLERLPDEIIQKDYGCGDPTRYVRKGDTVLDLGSGGGKLCYISSQVVGETGKVIGVDCNQTMLSLARKYRGEMAERLGYGNVAFHYGRIQDLALDLDVFNTELDKIQATDAERPVEILGLMRSLRQEQPMIADNSVDCVISNCVLNLVHPDDRKQLFSEIYRVLKDGGRAAISDIVSDEDVPKDMQDNGHLWSGCISGAWREDRFVDEFTEVGFHGALIDKYQEEPWQVVNGIEFRSATVMAYKGKVGPCWERNQAVVYKGPFEQAKDDDGNIYKRGQRVAVCGKTFNILMREPYAGMFLPVEPINKIPVEQAKPFDDRRAKLRDPRESKGSGYRMTILSDKDACDPSSDCC